MRSRHCHRNVSNVRIDKWSRVNLRDLWKRTTLGWPIANDGFARTWRRVVRIFWSFPFRSDAHEVFDANYEDANLEEDSDGNPLRLKVCVRLYGWSRIQNRRVVRKLQRRVKITPGIGFRVVRLLLQSSNLLSIDPGTYSDACLLGGGECLHSANNWPINDDPFGNFTCICHLCMTWEFLQHSCQFKLIYVSPDIFVCIPHGYESHKRRHGVGAFEVHCMKSTYLLSSD